MNEGTSSAYYGSNEDNYNGIDNPQECLEEQLNRQFLEAKNEELDFNEQDFYQEEIDKNDEDFQPELEEDTDYKERRFQCAACEKRFNRRCDLKRHLLVHNKAVEYKDKPFLCPEEGCGKRFVRNHDLNKHKKLHNGERNFKCLICEKTFSRNDNLQSHIKTHADVNSRNNMIGGVLRGMSHHIPILMPLNEIEPNNSEDVAETSEIPLDDLMNGPYTCDAKNCGMQFGRRTDFILHYKSHIYRKVFKCTVCSHVFSKSANLTAHMRVHTGERPFHCSCCGLMFARKADRDRHYNRQHLPSDTFKCTEDNCTATFSRKADLGRHLKRHYREDEKEENPAKSAEELAARPLIHSCPKCPEMFRTRLELRIHKNTHGQIEYCGVCGQKFEIKAEFREHSRSHVAEERLKCRICSRMYSKPANLKAHMRIHTGEKQYNCKVCGLGFNRKPIFEMHQKMAHLENVQKKSPKKKIPETNDNSHSEADVKMENPNIPEPIVTVCPYCPSTFSSIETLEDHLKIHEEYSEDVEFDEIEYKPDITNRESLFKWLSCDICGEPFTNEEEHFKHMEEHRESEELERPPKKK